MFNTFDGRKPLPQAAHVEVTVDEALGVAHEQILRKIIFGQNIFCPLGLALALRWLGLVAGRVAPGPKNHFGHFDEKSIFAQFVHFVGYLRL